VRVRLAALCLGQRVGVPAFGLNLDAQRRKQHFAVRAQIDLAPLVVSNIVAPAVL
jgi:hypothetical protein